MKNRKVKQILSVDTSGRGSGRCWYQWEGGGYKEWVKEGEYGINIMYSYMKMDKWDLLKLFQEWWERG
jgi:hypothetical protein